MPFIKDAIYSYMAIPEYFQPLIDSLPVQRLRRIRQLAGVEYVYPGATHSRFEHSLGVMYLAGKLCDILNDNEMNSSKSKIISDDDKKLVMAAALLHDIGHGPFSHVYEKLYENQDKNHEDISRWLINSYLSPVLARMELDPEDVGKLATGIKIDSGKIFLGQIIAGTIDCDSLDYFVRDSYYTGALVGTLDVNRILLMTKVYKNNLVFDLKVGLPILESYFLVRLNSFKQIYFHKTARAAQIMIYNALENKKDEFALTNFNNPNDFLKWDDYTIWTTIQDDFFIKKLKKRELLKLVFEKVDLDGTPFQKKMDDQQIKTLADKIALDAGLDEGSVFIDVPYLSTVPYAHTTSFDPEDVPIYIREKKMIRKLSDLSIIFSILKGYHNFIRVYTWKKWRDIVARSAKKILEA
ncbi:MAG: HD domain-containing protein [Promethearchaeota archaeon]